MSEHTGNQTDIVKVYSQLWETNNTPDVFSFLEEHAYRASNEATRILLADQYRRWSAGVEIPVEEYLEKVSDLDGQQQLQLIEEELGYLESRDLLPTRDQVEQRFSWLPPNLLEQLIEGLNLDSGEKDVLSSLSFIEQQPAEVPKSIGRYQVESRLGGGSFGEVYLATDPELGRHVAIKVPRKSRTPRRRGFEAFQTEARILAQLDHPNIVPVYDFTAADELCYVVSKYVDGCDLAELSKSQLGTRDATELVATVARALYHAHKRGLVHRDVKPSNILIDNDGRAHVADFGLAMRDEEFGSGKGFVGTPAYMSPEQARGEGHRVDGRSDIYSLGIVLYELLAGRRPYRKAPSSELVDQIKSGDLRPPRQFNDKIPRVLDRICMKAISRRASERYSTALDFAEDLEAFLEEDQQSGSNTSSSIHAADTRGDASSTRGEESKSSSSGSAANSTTAKSSWGDSTATSIRIVPQGLRSFDANDADFFLELLPGPRDRFGVPDSLRFWKNRIESTDAESTFTVGLIYGPSGCGKSSFVRAGLFPLLDERISPIYIEAAPTETEHRILRSLRRQHPGLPNDIGLTDSIAKLRKAAHRTGQKTLIIVDQFEQWLHNWQNDADAELIQTLRQCDGNYVQTILMIRDDFWMAATRFMRELEVPLVENQNSSAVDLFSIQHAERVLHAFGVAFGKLPEKGQLTSNQKRFLISAVDGLAEDKKIVSVRLALFAEMLKDQSWTLETLKDMGGSTGVGLAFLENSFGANAPPQQKLHVTAARRALESLLPIAGANIKGNMQSLDAIAATTGYNDERDLSELIRILDNDLRLITPTDPYVESDPIEVPNHERITDKGGTYYQLTHDYLVPSVREWLDRSLKATRKGRAQLMLRDMSQLWSSRPEPRLLPSVWETIQLKTLTDSRNWSSNQRDFMGSAVTRHMTRSVMMLLLAMFAVFICYEGVARSNAKQQVERLLVADPSDVTNVVDLASKPNRWLKNELRLIADDKSRPLKQRRHASIALLNIDQTQVPFLAEQVADADEEQLGLLTQALEPYKQEASVHLWPLLDGSGRTGRLNAAAVLAEFAANDERWSQHAAKLAQDIVEVPSESRLHFHRLKPIASQLVSPLLVEANRDDVVLRRVAAEGVRDYINASDSRLLDLIESADAEQFKILMPLLVGKENSFIAEFRKRLQLPRYKRWPAADVQETELLSAEVVGVIESAHGKLADDFVYWFDMPFDRIQKVAVAMKAAKYRPVNVRPFPSTRGLLCASCWVRDDCDWILEAALTGDQLESADEKYRQQGLLPDDTACYFLKDDVNELRSCVVWRAFENSNVRRAFYSGKNTDEHVPQQLRLQKLHMFERSRHLTTSPDGLLLKHSMIWALDEDNREDGFFYHCPEDEFLIVHRTQNHPTDISVTRARTDDGKETYAHYSAMWVNRSDRFQGRSVIAQGFGEHATAADALSSKGYRPVSVSAAEISKEDWRIASVWHRPFMSPAENFAVAKVKANIIAALLRLGDTEAFLHALSHAPTLPPSSVHLQPLQVGGRLQSANEFHTELVNVPASHGCDPALLVAALDRTKDPVVQHRLTLALGNYKPDDLEPGTLKAATMLVGVLVNQRNNASTRAAAEWCLRLWDRLDLITTALEQRSIEPSSTKAWYVDLNGHVMHVFDRTMSDEPFLMGCPLSENGAFWEDRQHNKRIGRKFAMSSSEVTVGQFEEFLKANGQFVHIADRDAETNMPASKIPWFVIANYCNWLSEKHGIPEDQWCFKMYGNDDVAPRISLAADYVTKLGYRLPTEAEWEYCCRANSSTAYPFGEASNRLSAYAWYAENSNGRSHKVAQLMPNAFGMFDMLGNVHEWCMELHEGDLTQHRSIINQDHADRSHVPRQDFRLIRGGSFNSEALSTRSGSREPLHAYKRRHSQGFRVVRTLPTPTP